MSHGLESERESTSPARPGALTQPSISFDVERRALKISHTAQQRYLAAFRLREWGERAVEPLCRALRDPSPLVRAGAADSLGYIGGPGVLPALNRALRETMVGGSRDRQHAWVAGAGAVLVATAALLFWSASTHVTPLVESLFPPLFILLVLALLMFGGSIVQARRHNVARIAIAQALARIAARTGAPELTASLSDLEVMARGGWGQSTQAVIAAREAAEAVRASASTSAHPIPAGAPDALEKLPVPADGGGGAPSAMLLPVAARSTEERGHD